MLQNGERKTQNGVVMRLRKKYNNYSKASSERSTVLVGE
jgi:hypothetical protein